MVNTTKPDEVHRYMTRDCLEHCRVQVVSVFARLMKYSWIREVDQWYFPFKRMEKMEGRAHY